MPTILLAIGLGIPMIVRAAPGDLDPSFGTSGTVTTAIGSSAPAVALVVTSDGRPVAAGWTIGSTIYFALARYNADGSPDTTFGTGGTVTTAIGSRAAAHALVLQADGKLVAAGFATNGGTDGFALARYNPNGSLDATFGTGGTVTTAVGSSSAYADALVLQSDNKLVAAGYTFDPSGTGDIALARYNPNGSLDTTFGTGGTVTTAIGSRAYASALVLQPDDKLVAAGATFSGSGPFVFALARYNPDGGLDATFGTGGTVTTLIESRANASALALQPNGQLVAAGSTGTSGNGPFAFALARYNAEGSLDTTFGMGGTVTTLIGSNASAGALVLQPDGRLVAAGSACPPSSCNTSDFALARYNADGSPDTTFGTSGTVTTAIGSRADASALVLDANGKLVAAGDTSNGSTSDFALARYLNDVCSNGVVEPGEECDTGMANGTASSCCTTACQFAAPGTPCTGGACDATGTCVIGAPTSTTTTSTTTTSTTGLASTTSSTMVTTTTNMSTSSTATSTPSTTTTSTTLFGCGSVPATMCQPAAARGARLLLGGGRLMWSWTSGTGTTRTDFGSPAMTTGYVLCVYDALGQKIDAQAPAGRVCGTNPCWSTLGTVGFKYRDRTGTPDGLTKVVLRAGGPERGRIQVKGGGANLHLPTLPLMIPVRVQLQRSASSVCWEATYGSPTTNTTRKFKATSD